MSCFSCFGGGDRKKKESASKKETDFTRSESRKSDAKPKNTPDATSKEGGSGNINAKSFTFRELAAATKNFRPDSLLGEGGFGRVYKGCFENTGQVVAIKQLDRNGSQGNKEFLVEVLVLSLLHHPNLVNLLGYCADGDQRLLVYEYMPSGSLETHLFDIPPDKPPLSWQARMKIASGAAQGLEYLHDKANPPVIYRDLKSSNILFDGDFNPRLSDFGLAKLRPGGSTLPMSAMMGTYDHCAPELARNGEASLKSDVYSFGVLLLELITGRRVNDATMSTNLVSWAQPMFRDQKRFPELVDPRLNGDYPVKGLNQAVGVAAMCLQEEACVRPFMGDVVMALSFLMNAPPDSPISVHTPPREEHAQSSSDDSSDNESAADHEDEYDDDDDDDEDAEATEEGSAASSRCHSRSSRRRHSPHGSDSE